MNNRSSRNFYQVLVNNIVVTGLQAVFFLIFASLLPPEEYGHLSYLIALAGTFSIVSRFGLPYTVTVYQSKNNLLMSNQSNVLATILTSIAAIILLFIEPFAALLCMAISFFVMNQHNLLGQKKYGKYLWTGILKSISIICIPFILYFFLDISGILLGMAIGNFVSSFHFLKSLSKKINSFNEIKTNFKVILHNFAIDSSSSLARVIDKLIIFPILGFMFLGIYQFNLQLMFSLTIFPNALNSFLLSEESSGKTHANLNYLIVITTSFLAILAIFLAPLFVNSFFPQYSLGIQSLQIMLVSLLPVSISAIINAKLQAKESIQVGYSAIFKIVSLLIFIVIFGTLYELVGLAIAILLSSCVEMISLVLIYLKQKKSS